MIVLARAFLVSCAFVFAAASAATQEKPYQPQPGQKGKDVVWIPSPTDMVGKMLDLAAVTPQDFVVDLGSGDGRNVIAAAKRGARALGVEYNPELVELSKRSAAAAGVAGKALFVQGDMFAADVSHATALILFLIPDNLRRLTSKFLELRPGTRIVSNTYEIPLWDADDTYRHTPCATWCTAFLYIVPAKAAGTWRLPQGELTLEQDFQQVRGTYQTSGLSVPVEGAMRGAEIRFSINGVDYSGRVNGDTMEGIAQGRATSNWTATRLR